MDSINEHITQEEAKLADILRQQNEALIANNRIQLEKEGLEAGVLRMTASLETLEERKKDLERKVDDLSFVGSSRQEEVNTLDIQIAQAKQKLENIKKEIDLEAQNAGVLVEKAKIEAEAIVTNAKQGVKDEEAKRNALIKDSTDLLDQVVRSRQELTNLSKTYALKDAELEQLVHEIAGKEELSREVSYNVEKLTIQVSSLQKEVDAANETKKAVEDEISNLVANKASLLKEIAEYEAKKGEYAQKEIEFVKNVETVNTLRTNLQNAQDFLKTKYTALNENWPL